MLVVLAGPGAGIQGQRRLVVMGFNGREMEDQRRTAAEKGSGDAASRVSLVPGIVLTASMPKSYSGAHCARSTAATDGAIDRLGVGCEKIV